MRRDTVHHLFLQFNSLITKETKWKLNHFSQTLLFTVTLKNCFWSFEMMVNLQIHYMCGSMWWPVTSLHTLYIWPLPIRECGVSLEQHSYSCLVVKVPLSRSCCGITAKRVCDGVGRWEKRSWWRRRAALPLLRVSPYRKMSVYSVKVYSTMLL